MPTVCKYVRPGSQTRIFKPPAVRRIVKNVRMHGFSEREVWAACRSAPNMDQDAVARIQIAALKLLIDRAQEFGDVLQLIDVFLEVLKTVRSILKFFGAISRIFRLIFGFQFLRNFLKLFDGILAIIVDLPEVLEPIIGELQPEDFAEAHTRVDDLLRETDVGFTVLDIIDYVSEDVTKGSS